MGLLDKLLRRKPEVAAVPDERKRMVSGEPGPSPAQEQMNRDLMEQGMADSRAKRDAAEQAAADKA